MDDAVIIETLTALLDARAPGATLCPSEVARALHADDATWRSSMPAVRRVAAVFARQGLLRVTRRGLPVDAEEPGGPIRLSRP